HLDGEIRRAIRERSQGSQVESSYVFALPEGSSDALQISLNSLSVALRPILHVTQMAASGGRAVLRFRGSIVPGPESESLMPRNKRTVSAIVRTTLVRL